MDFTPYLGLQQWSQGYWPQQQQQQYQQQYQQFAHPYLHPSPHPDPDPQQLYQQQLLQYQQQYQHQYKPVQYQPANYGGGRGRGRGGNPHVTALMAMYAGSWAYGICIWHKHKTGMLGKVCVGLVY